MKTLKIFADQLREANTAFLGELKHLESMIEAMVAVPAADLGRRLLSIRGVAAEHFRLVEEDGYLHPLVTCRPDLESQRKSLISDHHALLLSLDALIRDTEAGEGLTDYERGRLRQWIKDVKHHEERETEFFDEASDEEPC